MFHWVLNPGKFTSTKQPPLICTANAADTGRSAGRTSPTVGSWSPSPTIKMQSACRMQRWVQGVRVLSAWYSTMRWISSCCPSQLVRRYSWVLGTEKKKTNKFKRFDIIAPGRVERNHTCQAQNLKSIRALHLLLAQSKNLICPHSQAHAFFISPFFIPLDIYTEERGRSGA